MRLFVPAAVLLHNEPLGKSSHRLEGGVRAEKKDERMNE